MKGPANLCGALRRKGSIVSVGQIILAAKGQVGLVSTTPVVPEGERLTTLGNVVEPKYNHASEYLHEF